MMPLLQEIQAALNYKEFSITLHAQQQITVRHISISDIRAALLSSEAEVIENYPGDPRGPSCLVFGKVSDRVLHAHISYPPEIAVITAYEPNPAKWEADLKTRKGNLPMKTCPRCKSDSLESQTIQYFQEYDGNFYIIAKVPAHLCTQCGEIILSENVAERIQQKVWSAALPKRIEPVPVYEMA